MSELARYDPDTGEMLGYEPPIVPVADARPTWHEAGRIRIGVKVPIPGKPGKFRPAKLIRFRLTSPDQDLIERAAKLYGGQPEAWDDAPGADREDGEQWQVTTHRSSLPVRIPPAAAASQAWEAWSGPFCDRRCNGVTEQFTDGPCLCAAEAEEAAAEGNGYERPCRLVTRVSVMLDDFGAGIWRLETKSVISGQELATWLRLVFPYLPPMAPLVLRVTKTTRKRRIPDQRKPRGWDWQTFVFPLVSIDTRDQTIGELLAQRQVAAPAPVREVAGRVTDAQMNQSSRQPSDPGMPSDPPRPHPGGSTGSDITSEAVAASAQSPHHIRRGQAKEHPGDSASPGDGAASGDQSPEPNPSPTAAAGSGEPTSPASPGDAKPGRRTRDATKGKGGEADPPPAGPNSDEAEQAAFEQTLADDDGRFAR